jgi:coenzyme Q-binding protein COQ10
VLYDIITDVLAYPEFLPWCQDAKIISRNDMQMQADLTVGHPPFVETYSSLITMESPHRVVVVSRDSAMKSLYTHWLLETLSPQMTRVFFKVDFELNSFILNRLISGVLEKAAEKMMRAFIERAKRVGGHTP